MEIRIYDSSFNFIGIIENQSSLLWNRKYNDVGSFTLIAPLIQDNIRLLQMGRIVWVKGKVEAGVIESIEMTADSLGYSLKVEGRFLECYLSRRLVNVTDYSGRVEAAMYDLIEGVAEIPMLVIGEDKGFTDTIEFQAVYRNLLTCEMNLAKGAALGFRLIPDFVEKQFTFEVYQGVDHSATQYDRTKVTFSDEYENLVSIRSYENEQTYYNVCIVGGQGEDQYKTYVTVGDTESTGLDRREMYYEASEVTSNGMTWANYLEALKTKGREVLEEYKSADEFDCTILSNGNFIYGKDYDIGDIVTVKKSDWDLSKDLRLTAINEIYEHEIPSIEIILGDTLPETITWSD